MTRKPASAGEAASPYAALLKPVFAPALTPLSALEHLVYMDIQHESYDAKGAPRLHLGDTPDDGTNALVRINVGGSDLSPSVRRVFIPQQPGSTAFLLESIDGEPGLAAAAIANEGEGRASVTVWLLPLSAIADVSQGDHDGMMQVNLLQPGALRTTVHLQVNGAGYLKYATSGTSIDIDDITQAQRIEIQRRVEGELGGQIAAICGQFVFDLPPAAPPGAKAPTGAMALPGLAVPQWLKTSVIAVLQIGGLTANALGFVYGPVPSGVGGILRGFAGLMGLAPATPAPVLKGLSYACAIDGEQHRITIG